jgi:hypothetical protein
MKFSKSLKRFPLYCGIGALMLLTSCVDVQLADFQHGPSVLPGEVPMNHDAGRGGLIVVTIQLEDGEILPFVLDSGSPATCFDKSLEPKLGKPRGKTKFETLDGSKYSGTFYEAPKLFLQDVRLVTGGPVVAFDFKTLSSESGRPIKGIIGMDVLKHYCIQLDFKANKIRFLDDWLPDRSGWGKPFDLHNMGGVKYIDGDLAGTFFSVGSIVDTGCNYDGWLEPRTFREWADNSKRPWILHAKYPNAILDGDVYTNVVLSDTTLGLSLVRIPFTPVGLGIKYNGIGLNFLARNLVTLDFRRNAMFLKQTTVGPLEDKESIAAENAEGKLACEFLKNLKEKGKLPGWSKDDQWPTHDVTFQYFYPETFFMDRIQKPGDPAVYQYVAFRTDKGAPWQLVAARRADEKGKTLKEYPIAAKKPGN